MVAEVHIFGFWFAIVLLFGLTNIYWAFVFSFSFFIFSQQRFRAERTLNSTNSASPERGTIDRLSDDRKHFQNFS